jgi:FkbM family methyltransferase
VNKNFTSVLSAHGQWRRLGWIFTSPLRWYLRDFPLQRGKGLLLRHCLLPLLPRPPAEYEAILADGSRMRFQYRETIGWSSLLYGPFEQAELAHVRSIVEPGDTVFDIGANIGLFSVVLGRAVGPTGRVVAAEPVAANAERARRNFALNGLDNVQIVAAAIGDTTGSVSLNLSDDAAYPSIGMVAESRGNGRVVDVPLRRLDDIWRELGEPAVRFIKIDVEGAEEAVLRGAMRLLTNAGPTLLLEANDAPALENLRRLLSPLGYTLVQPAGYSPHNHLAIPERKPRAD